MLTIEDRCRGLCESLEGFDMFRYVSIIRDRRTPDVHYSCKMTHALKNYSRVSTRLWNNFFWNNFQGIIFEGGRYTIMHVGI